jgi:hypothetical protein
MSVPQSNRSIHSFTVLALIGFEESRDANAGDIFRATQAAASSRDFPNSICIRAIPFV